MLNNSQKIKEFFNLNGYYLRLILTNQQLTLISYNSLLLNGIKYESRINYDEIKRNEKIKDFTVSGLYDLIIKKINEKKFSIKGDQNYVVLSLLETNKPNADKDIQLTMLRNKYFFTSDYENVLANVIMNLRQENKHLKSELAEIKNMLKSNNNNNNINLVNRNQHAEVKVLKSIPFNQSQTINPGLNISQNMTHNSIIINQMPNTLNNSTEFTINQIDNLSKTLPAPIRPQNMIINPPVAVENPKVNVINNFKDVNIDFLANLDYKLYPQVQISSNAFGKICGYGANSYNGLVKNFNEDKLKVILDYKLNRIINDFNGNIIYPNISYFAIYDGHGGSKCSNFLQEKLDSLLFNSTYFPLYTLQAIYDGFTKAEQEFDSMAFDLQKNILLDKSGSCALSLIIMDDWCYISYLGDSRGLYSFDSGNQLFQITRDHKPNDPQERDRIEKAGGKVYKDTRLKINGHKIYVNEQALPGIKFPFRVSPGNLSVS
jgi:serine/threonine protein phosphatase PrpC